MRLSITILAVCFVSAAASAQTEKKVWTDAPVPGSLPSSVAPADRAGNNSGPDQSAPFSGLPTGARTSGQSSGTTRDGGTPSSDAVTPNLSR